MLSCYCMNTSVATKRLKEFLEVWESSACESSVSSMMSNGHGINVQRWIDHKLEVMVNVDEVHYQYERQSEVSTVLAEKLDVLRQVNELASNGVSLPRGKNGFSRGSTNAYHPIGELTQAHC